MLLSSIAESMFWTGRYLERAQALARIVQGYQRLALDLPDVEALDLGRLLALVGAEAPKSQVRREPPELLRLLIADAENPSSVLGSLGCARENLRTGRTVLPPAVWTSVNGLYTRLGELDCADAAAVFAVLDSVQRAASEVEGELFAGMTRDAAYAFIRIGAALERADMLLRALATLLPILTESGERLFDDVRFTGVSECLGARAMYRRRHHTRVDLSTLLHFVLVDATFPRSVAHALVTIETELDRLPRPGAARAALAACRSSELSAACRGVPAFLGGAARINAAVERLGSALMNTYFPGKHDAAVPSVPPARRPADPFEQLGHEHATVESVLRILDELAAHAACGARVPRRDIRAVLTFFDDFGVLGHHEKEEAILMPMLLDHGFDWNDGPLAAMRRDHRQEHYFLRVLGHLASQDTEWSNEDRERFTSVTQELTRFLRRHMRLEQREVFEPAALRLSEASKASLSASLMRFDSDAADSFEDARRRIEWLLEKYVNRRAREPQRAAAAS